MEAQYSETYTEKLTSQKKFLEDQLAQVNAALNALKAQPEKVIHRL